jgi:tetratricopeptide (TPR) repeat protein
MNQLILILLSVCSYTYGIAQKSKKSKSNTLLIELAENGCLCVDSINVYNKSSEEVSQEISKCINDQTGAYQMGSKLMQIDDSKEETKSKKGKKEINISIDLNEDSKEYKQYYYELERYMVENCPSIKEKIARNEKQSAKSFSENPEALEFYSKGLEDSKKGNHDKAIKNFEKAVGADPEFAFAWDNLGLSYRKIENYDKAIESYKKSLEIDPQGTMPLQNLAVAYQYKKEYQNAIDAYEKLADINPDNPEIYYGIGQIYTSNLNDLEQGLNNMCKAYNLYVEQKSPYRTDAEKIINLIFSEMKKQGKEETFYKILKENKIESN